MSKMEEQLRGADFSSASEGLQERIWQRVRQGIDAQQESGERELTDDELDQVAAASWGDVSPGGKMPDWLKRHLIKK